MITTDELEILHRFGSDDVQALVVEVRRVASIGSNLAYALRLAVTSEFPEQRRAALDQWETYMLDLARKTAPEGE